MRKKISIILAVLCICMLTGCGKNQTAGKGELKIFLTVSQGDTFRNALIDEAKQVADENGAVLDAADAEGLVENQVQQIRDAAEAEYDVIICNPVDTATALELEAEADGIPIVFFNSCPDEQRLKADKYVYVGSNEAYAGEYQAEYILEHFSEQDEINVVIIKGQLNHSATDGRTDALVDMLNASGKTINYVFKDVADWDQQKAKELFELFLMTDQKFDCVVCNNDAMALGMIEACRENQINPSSIPILGVDATADGCAEIENGNMVFTVYQSAKGQGEYCVRAALALGRGESLEGLDYLSDDGKYVWVPFEKVDKSNVGNYE